MSKNQKKKKVKSKESQTHLKPARICRVEKPDVVKGLAGLVRLPAIHPHHAVVLDRHVAEAGGRTAAARRARVDLRPHPKR